MTIFMIVIDQRVASGGHRVESTFKRLLFRGSPGQLGQRTGLYLRVSELRFPLSCSSKLVASLGTGAPGYPISLPRYIT